MWCRYDEGGVVGPGGEIKVVEPKEQSREEYLQEQLAQQLNLPALADTSAPALPTTNKVLPFRTLLQHFSFVIRYNMLNS
jgi:hypothetical protein